MKKCTKCGRLYPEDAAFCPGCKHPNELMVEETRHEDTNEIIADDATPFEFPKHDELPKRSGKKAVTDTLSRWDTFANVLMLLGGIAVLIVLIICFVDKWRTPAMFFVTLGAYISDLLFCGIVKLLARIEFNTRKGKCR